MNKNIKDYSRCDPILIGGIGDMKSNNGTQYYQQNRIYFTDVSTAVTTVCMPFFLIIENEKDNSLQITG